MVDMVETSPNDHACTPKAVNSDPQFLAIE